MLRRAEKNSKAEKLKLTGAIWNRQFAESNLYGMANILKPPAAHPCSGSLQNKHPEQYKTLCICSRLANFRRLKKNGPKQMVAR